MICLYADLKNNALLVTSIPLYSYFFPINVTITVLQILFITEKNNFVTFFGNEKRIR